jgi:NAD(P)-dependent dehydrogenase (short-subunit alcohol dehydrogenase family)
MRILVIGATAYSAPLARAAAQELPRGLRINAVAPGWVRETLLAFKMDPAPGIAAVEAAQTYVKAVEGKMTGLTLDVVKASS